jgi:hypothetical protein
LRTVLSSHPTEARAFLAKVFTGPLVFTPDGHRYRIDGEIPAESVLFAGAPNYASPGGFDHAGELGRVLAAAANQVEIGLRYVA